MRPAVATSTLHCVHIISGLGQGGAETVLFRLISAAPPNQHHTVISLTDDGVFGEKLRRAGIQVHALHMRGLKGNLGGLWQLYRLLRKLDPDIVQTWMYHADLIGGIIARCAGIRAIAWGIRNSGADLSAASRSARAFAWLGARASAWVPELIIACAHEAARRHTAWGYRSDRTLVIPNGYDLSRWAPDTLARQHIRASLGLSEDTLVVGSVARWNPQKDHATLISALVLVLQKFPTVRCLLVGDHMDTANTGLVQLLEKHKVLAQVILLGRRSDVPQLMNALDIHVLSSRAEGFPNVVAEAMATGVPCVVTDVGDAADIVGTTGWVTSPENPVALSQAICDALATVGTPDYSQRSQAGRERVSQRYSLESMVQAYQQAWSRLSLDFPRKRRFASMTQGQSVSPRRLLYVVNNPAFFVSHRLPVALQAQQAGFQIHVASMDGRAVTTLEEHGFIHHTLPLSRSGRNPLAELYSVFALWRLFRSVRPVLVHAITIKPVIYGGLASRVAGVPAFVAAVPGLGFLFLNQGQGASALRTVVQGLYRLALGHSNSRVIFQNTEDRDTFLRRRIVHPDQVVMIRGSGVNLEQFTPQPEVDGPPIAVMVSRLLTDKGVREFVDAARLSQGHSSGVRWVLVGSPDPGNPASVSAEEVQRWVNEGVIEWWGEQQNIADVYARTHIAVLPSYREGLPKSLIEAAACGRAVVTTDVPGCRDAIEPGHTGLLVPVRDARALMHAVTTLATDTGQRHAMGVAGRTLAEQAFDIQQVSRTHLTTYETLLKH